VIAVQVVKVEKEDANIDVRGYQKEMELQGMHQSQE